MTWPGHTPGTSGSNKDEVLSNAHEHFDTVRSDARTCFVSRQDGTAFEKGAVCFLAGIILENQMNAHELPHSITSVGQVGQIRSRQRWELGHLNEEEQMSYRCAALCLGVSFGLLQGTSNVFPKVCSRSSH